MWRLRPRWLSTLTALGLLANGTVISQKAPTPFDVAFVSTRDGRTGIHAMRGDGSSIRLVADVGRSVILTESSWSPDSTRLAFLSGFEDPNFVPPSPQSDARMAIALYVLSLENRRVKRLTPFNSSMGPVSWSADGRRLSFATDEVYVVDSDGGNVRRLTKTGGKVGGLAWSPRGDWMAFTEGERNDRGLHERGLLVIRPDGSGVKRLRTSESRGVKWAPDGGSIVVLQPEPTLIDIEKGTSTPFVLNSQAMDVMFSPDGRSLLFRGPRRMVYVLDLGSQTERELIELADGRSFTVSPLLRRPPR